MVEIFIVKLLKQLDPQVFNELILSIPKERQDRIRLFSNYKDAQRSLVADIIIRNIIYKKLNIAWEKILIETNDTGKPLLKNNKDFHFNLSHSGKFIVCAINDSPIGIDIEKIRPVDMDVAKNFFSQQEYNDLLKKTKEEKLSYFYGLWTSKESYIKAGGKDLSDDYFTKQYNIDPDYKLSVCSKNKNLPVIKSICNSRLTIS